MSKFKKITFLWLLFISVFLIFNFLVFFNYTSKVYPDTADTTIGDLARMSYMVDVIQEKENINNLTKKHLTLNEYTNEKIDVLTIGDSFSNGGAGGKNSYYQDYISTIYNKKVLNISAESIKQTSNYLEAVALLANSNYLKALGVKYVLIESVQREALVRFAVNGLNFSLISEEKKIFKKLKKNNQLQELHHLRPSVINNLNLNALLYNLKYYSQGYGKLNSNIYVERLNKELFTSDAASKLIFLHEDIKKLSTESKENIELLNKNFNDLADILNKQGIELIFVPAVDKYNLYRKYITSNTYQESIFFEYLRTLEKKYIFVDTKAILQKELDNGVKDIFYADDTHWSYKASEIIVNRLKF